MRYRLLAVTVAALSIAVFAAFTALAATAPDFPDPERTPGVRDPAVTQANIHLTICVRGYTRQVRPLLTVTNRIKRRQLAEWHYTDRIAALYKEDHLIALEIGGSPDDEKNLWPEPYAGGRGARVKDVVETELHRRVCASALDPDHISLQETQDAIATDWIAAYSKYVCHRTPRLPAKMRANCSFAARRKLMVPLDRFGVK